jgi:hypothetical protein
MFECIKIHSQLEKLTDMATEDLTLEEIADLLGMDEDSPFSVSSILSAALKPAIPTLLELITINIPKQDERIPELFSRAIKHYSKTWPLTYIGDFESLQQYAGITIEDYEKELTFKPKSLKKMFPDMAPSVYAFDKTYRQQVGKEKGVSMKTQTTKPMPSEKTRSQPTGDVGKHLLMPTATYENRDKARYAHFMRWVNDLMRGPEIWYRVPMPATYIGREKEIVNDGAVARDLVAQAIVNATGYPALEVEPVVRHLSKKIHFTVFPVSNLAHPVLDEQIDRSNTPLTHGLVINRKPTQV